MQLSALCVRFFIYFFAYLVGSIPSGYWFSRFVLGVNVTKKGSGNIGATNVARVSGKLWHFFLVAFLDAFKAFLFLSILHASCYGFLSHIFSECDLLVSAVCLMLGNGLSPFLQFSGGKGVSTFLGTLFVLVPWFVIAFFILCMAVLIWFTRRVAVASVLTVSAVPLVYVVFVPQYEITILIFLMLAAMWVFLRHQSNFRAFSRS